MSEEEFEEEVFIERPRDCYAERAREIAALMAAYEKASSETAKAILERAAERLIATMEVKESAPLGSKVRAISAKP